METMGVMPHDQIKLGSFLLTIVEPHKGHEVAYNRWYERDHFYSGCMIGPWTLAGGRYVATKDCKDLRTPAEDNEVTESSPRGSYIALYWIQDGKYKDWVVWGGKQVMWLHENGRMFEEREHVHTQLYKVRWTFNRDDDGVPAELALDHPFGGIVTVFARQPRASTAKSSTAGIRRSTCPGRWPGRLRQSLCPPRPASYGEVRRTCPALRAPTASSCTSISWTQIPASRSPTSSPITAPSSRKPASAASSWRPRS